MAQNGVKTTDLLESATLDSLLGNFAGTTVKILVPDMAQQLKSGGAFDTLPIRAGFGNHQALTVDNLMTYSLDQPGTVSQGDLISVGGYILEVASSTATDQHETTSGGIKLYESGNTFTSLQRFEEAVARGVQWVAGTIVLAGGAPFISVSGASGLPALSGFEPYGVVTPEHFGTTPDGPAFQAMFDYASVATNKAVRICGHYTLTSGCYIADPHGMHIDARGATFETANDILMFDLNAKADPTYSDNESRQNFNWTGGNFKCTLASPTKAAAFRWMGFRNSTLRPAHFEGFHTNIIMGGKDTLRVGEFKSYNCQHNILFPPWSAIGGPLLVNIHNIHNSHANVTTPAIKSYLPLADSEVRDVSFNLGTGAAHVAALDIERSVLIGVNTVTGAFTAGETVTGAASGATMLVAEMYTHPFPFQIAQPLTWLVGTDKSVANFVAGETLTGGTSGATAVIEGNAAYIVQNPTWQNFKIKGANHFESGSGAAGAVGVRLRDRIKRGQGSVQFDLDLGSVGINGGAAVGLVLENLSEVDIVGRFSQTAAGGVPIKFDASCKSVRVKKPAMFSSGVIDLNGMSRTELDLSEFNTTYSLPELVTGWSAKAVGTVATNSGAMIDLATDFPKYKTVGGIGPISARMRFKMADTGSAAATAARPRFRIHHPDYATSANFHELNVRGVPDSEPRQAEFTAGLSAAGEIEYDSIESGAATLTVSAWVTGLFF